MLNLLKILAKIFSKKIKKRQLVNNKNNIVHFVIDVLFSFKNQLN